MHKSLGAGLLLAILVVSTGCLGPRLARCPADGGSPWRVLESEHFTLKTDLPSQEAHEAIAYLERMRAALLAAAWPEAHGRPMEKLTVYVLGKSQDFENLFPSRLDGFFVRGNGELAIFIHGSPSTWSARTGDGNSLSTVKHELAHYLSAYSLIRQPRWLGEGLAGFLQTLELSEDGKTATVGRPYPHAVVWMDYQLQLVRNRQVLAWSAWSVFNWDVRKVDEYTPQQSSRFYAASWLLVHWLSNTRSEGFAKYQALLARGADPRKSFAEAFPELRGADIDSMLLPYLLRGSFKQRTVQVPSVNTSATERPLEDAEVHAVRARLALTASYLSKEGSETRLGLARTELAEALRLEPANLSAFALKVGEVPEEQRLPLARAAVAAHPQEGRAWYLLAQVLPQGASAMAEREDAYAKAVALSPNDASAANGLAWVYVLQGRYAEALPLATRAVELAPWNPSILDTYAMTVAGLGRCEEAIMTEQRALDVLQDYQDENLVKLFRDRLASFTSTSCVPKLTP
jgi:tetratricopeptide (TPR) repeat protein